MTVPCADLRGQSADGRRTAPVARSQTFASKLAFVAGIPEILHYTTIYSKKTFRTCTCYSQINSSYNKKLTRCAKHLPPKTPNEDSYGPPNIPIQCSGMTRLRSLCLKGQTESRHPDKKEWMYTYMYIYIARLYTGTTTQVIYLEFCKTEFVRSCTRAETCIDCRVHSFRRPTSFDTLSSSSGQNLFDRELQQLNVQKIFFKYILTSRHLHCTLEDTNENKSFT